MAAAAASSSAAAAADRPRKILMVTADDLGYAPERDAGIIEGFEKGCITQASLLVNGPTAAKAVALASAARANPALTRLPSPSTAAPGLPLGLHFNLTEGRALSGDKGEMPGKAGLWQLSREGKLVTADAVAELRAQIAAFRLLVGHLPHYLDGHNHVHVLPAVVDAICEVLPAFPAIKCVRVPVEEIASPDAASASAASAAASSSPTLPAAQRAFFEEIKQHVVKARSRFEAIGLRTSDHFVGLQLMGSNNSAKRLLRALKRTPPGVTEYMCHAGYPSTIGDDFSRSEDRAHELSVLCNAKVLSACSGATPEVTLASWSSLIGQTAPASALVHNFTSELQ